MDLNAISSHLKCPLCKELFENPKHLPCGHDICERCLQCHIIRTVPMVGYNIYDFLDKKTPDIKPSETYFNCPIDKRELTPLKPSQEVSKWASQFENNLKLVTMLEICNGKVRGVTEYCDNCIEVSQKVAATSVCFTCTEKYCVQCAFIHRHTHPKDSLLNLSAVKCVLSDNSHIAVENCKIHIFRQLILYCLNCEEKCCRTCQKTMHVDCKHVTQLDDEFGEYGVGHSLEQLVDRLKKVLCQLSVIMKNDLELFDKAKELIGMDNRVKCYNFDDMLGGVRCGITRLESYHEQIQLSLNYLNELKQETVKTKPYRVIQTEIECQQMEKAIECHKKLALDNFDRLEQFKNVLDKHKRENKSMGIVHLPNRRNKNLTTKQIDYFGELVNIKSDNKLVDMSEKVRLVHKINMRANDDDNDCWLTDCLFLKVDFLIIADKANECIKWIINNGQINSLVLKSGPQCLAVDKQGNTGCVTLPYDKRIQFFCIKDTSIMLTDNLQTKQKCFGVDFLSEECIVVSREGYPESSSVSILNKDGTEMRCFLEKDEFMKEKLFSDPRYLKVRRNGDELKIFVTDFRLRTVTCISSQWLEGSFTSQSIFHDKMGAPLGVDYDDNGNLLVCSNSTGNVQQVILCTNDSERHHRLLTQHLWLPRAVSVLKGGNMFMITSDSGPCKNHVLVYEFISKAC